MRRMIPIVTAVLILAAVRAHADEPAAPVAAPTAAGPEAVEIHGTLPDSLKGTWLMIQSADANKRFVNFWTIYTIAHNGSLWSMEQLTGPTPSALPKALEAANKAGQRLEPDQKLLTAVRTAAAKMKRPKVAERNKRYIFYTAGNKPNEDNEDVPELKDATLVLGLVSSTPDAASSGSEYYFQEVTADKLSGKFRAGIVAITRSAPVIPIGIKGDVALYRLK